MAETITIKDGDGNVLGTHTIDLSAGLRIEGIPGNVSWNLTTVNTENEVYVDPHFGERPTREER